MPRDGAIIFSDLIGKLDVLRRASQLREITHHWVSKVQTEEPMSDNNSMAVADRKRIK